MMITDVFTDQPFLALRSVLKTWKKMRLAVTSASSAGSFRHFRRFLRIVALRLQFSLRYSLTLFGDA